MKRKTNKISVVKRDSARQKTFVGKVVSLRMEKTAVVKIQKFFKHPLYKKTIKKDKKLKVDTGGLVLSIGDVVKIGETRPVSKEKSFKVLEVIK